MNANQILAVMARYAILQEIQCASVQAIHLVIPSESALNVMNLNFVDQDPVGVARIVSLYKIVKNAFAVQVLAETLTLCVSSLKLCVNQIPVGPTLYVMLLVMADLLVDVLMVWEAIQQVLSDAKAMNVKSMKNAEILKLVLVLDVEIHVREVSIFKIFVI